jgi:hypothetical protein
MAAADTRYSGLTTSSLDWDILDRIAVAEGRRHNIPRLQPPANTRPGEGVSRRVTRDGARSASAIRANNTSDKRHEITHGVRSNSFINMFPVWSTIGEALGSGWISG